MARQAVDRTVEHVVAVVDVLRRERPFEDDVSLEVFHAGCALEFLDDPAAVWREHLRPVVMGPQVGRVHEHVERLAPGGRDAGFGDGRRADIAGRVGGRLTAAVDHLELLVRIVREDEVVVDQLFVALVEAEVEHDARAGRLVAATVQESLTRLSLNQFAVRAHAVGIADNGPCGDRLARVGFDAPDPAPFDDDSSDRRPGADFHAQINGQTGQCPRHSAGAAAGIPDPLVRLHVGDATEHRRRGVGRTADILREMIEHLGRPLVGHERPHGACHAAARPHPHHLFHD